VEDSFGQSVRSAPGAEPAADVVSAPAVAGSPLLDRRFGRDEIAVVRHEVTGRLTGAGLLGERLQGFVLAVNEVITNVVLHADGHGRLVLWLTGGSAWCTVTDAGPGIPAHILEAPDVPGAFEVGGRGVWLARQLCDEMTVATGPIGTTIGLRIVLPHRTTAG
jgi:anti-sigma regulatory factor (Ser/Thr protein kinase)